MRTTAIVVTCTAVVWVFGCRPTGSRGPVGTVIQKGVEVPHAELAADRPVPRRTNASRVQEQPERLGPGRATPQKTARPAPAPKPAATRRAASAPAPRPAVPPSRTEASGAPPAAGKARVPEPAARPTAKREAAKKPEEAGALVVVPSQGRPVMVRPGEEFFFVMRLRKSVGKRFFVWLAHSRVPQIRVNLRADFGLAPVHGQQHGQTILKIPEKIPPGLYDLEVEGKDGSHFSRHSVRVIDQWRNPFRFVHLSNMNIDDPAAPEFDQLLIDEINLLAPEFVVCTGDFTEWGRVLGNPIDWRRTLEFLGQIHAPTYIVCGDHDDEASFRRHVADNEIGTLDYGEYHGILMLDHAAHPIDNAQLKWLKADLDAHQDVEGFNFVVMHNDDLHVLDMLRRDVGDLPTFVRAHKLRMIITGGHSDWDLREFASKLKGLDSKKDLVYIRTHQSSTCMHDRATGISHYRVIEVDGNQIRYRYRDDTAPVAHDSIPVGRLRVFYSGKNDGTEDAIVATVMNALNREFDSCRVWLAVAKASGERPGVRGGKLVRVLDGGGYWMCEVGVDLPDKGGRKVMVANRAALLPKPLPIEAKLAVGAGEVPGTATGPSVPALLFKKEHGGLGVTYYRCEQKVALVLTNTSDAAEEVWPVVRLNGQAILLDWSAAFGDRKPLIIQPGKSARLPMKLVLGRVSPGEHQLQVFFRSDPLKRLTTFRLMLKQAR